MIDLLKALLVLALIASLLMALWGLIGCVWQFCVWVGRICASSSTEEKWFENHYYCRACDEEWQDCWTCACDDECPKCGTAISPCRSVDFNDSRAD